MDYYNTCSISVNRFFPSVFIPIQLRCQVNLPPALLRLGQFFRLRL